MTVDTPECPHCGGKLDAVARLSRDLAAGAATLGRREARFLVDSYYVMQEERKRAGNQVRALGESEEPHDVLVWFLKQSDMLETQVRRALAKYAEGHPVGQWALSVRGIGPVITAGLLAHLSVNRWVCAHVSGDQEDEEKACTPAKPHGPECVRVRTQTVGHWWRFAGLDPSVTWDRGEKRPWNASLKTLCWKIGESFVKTKGHESAIYGAIYDDRKAYEIVRNERGEYADQAAGMLARRPKHAQRKTYAQGKLPDGHLHARAKRYVVKIFLSHLHEVWYEHEFGEKPPLPYAITQLGHAHKIAVPGRQ